MMSLKTIIFLITVFLFFQNICGQLTFGVSYNKGYRNIVSEYYSFGLYEEYSPSDSPEVVDGTMYYQANSIIDKLSLDAKYRLNTKHGVKVSLSYYQDNWTHKGVFYDKELANEAIVVFSLDDYEWLYEEYNPDYTDDDDDDDFDDDEGLFEEENLSVSQYKPRFETLRTHYLSLSLGYTFYIRERFGVVSSSTFLFKTSEISTYHLYDNNHLNTTTPQIDNKSNIMPWLNMDLGVSMFCYVFKNKVSINAGFEIHNLAFSLEPQDEHVFDFPGLEYNAPLLFTTGISWDIYTLKSKRI